MAAKFDVKVRGSGFQWVPSSQGRTLATSPIYARRAMAEKAIASFRAAAVAAPVDDRAPTRGKAAPTRKAPEKTTRSAGRRVAQPVAEAEAEAETMELVEQGLAKLDATVTEIKKVVGRAGRQATVTAPKAARRSNMARRRAAKG